MLTTVSFNSQPRMWPTMEFYKLERVCTNGFLEYVRETGSYLGCGSATGVMLTTVDFTHNRTSSGVSVIVPFSL